MGESRSLGSFTLSQETYLCSKYIAFHGDFITRMLSFVHAHLQYLGWIRKLSSPEKIGWVTMSMQVEEIFKRILLLAIVVMALENLLLGGVLTRKDDGTHFVIKVLTRNSLSTPPNNCRVKYVAGNLAFELRSSLQIRRLMKVFP